jgi:predicted ribosome-associated RNA-binding protein Tma20
VTTESGASKENAELYAEALRRGGAIVTAKVPDKDEAKYAAIMDESAIDIVARGADYRKSGWIGYDPAAPAYDMDQVRKERDAYRM